MCDHGTPRAYFLNSYREVVNHENTSLGDRPGVIAANGPSHLLKIIAEFISTLMHIIGL
jgi:hypothetical protein